MILNLLIPGRWGNCTPGSDSSCSRVGDAAEAAIELCTIPHPIAVKLRREWGTRICRAVVPSLVFAGLGDLQRGDE
jgi:hypothetical protein